MPPKRTASPKRTKSPSAKRSGSATRKKGGARSATPKRSKTPTHTSPASGSKNKTTTTRTATPTKTHHQHHDKTPPRDDSTGRFMKAKTTTTTTNRGSGGSSRSSGGASSHTSRHGVPPPYMTKASLAPPITSSKNSVGKIDPVANKRRRRFTPEADTWSGRYEFTVLGCLLVMTFSHFIMYYFWFCIERFNGQVIYPGHALLDPQHNDLVSLWHIFVEYASQHAIPSPAVFAIFSGFYLLQYIMAIILPGPVTYGLPLPSENGYQLSYKCNAVWAWYVILAIVGVLHYTDIFPLYYIKDHFGEFMTSAVIFGDVSSVLCYLNGIYFFKNSVRMSGNLIYDFFMGSSLNVRLPGNVDLKLWAEIRNSWMLLFLLTLSCAASIYKETGEIPPNVWLIVTAHFLYSNACQKGEECIATTWDIFSEKFGWMLIFWNFAGVPFVYSFQSLFLATVRPPPLPLPVTIIFFIALFIAYYMFDTINSQKNRFRMMRQGVDMAIIRRRTFPQLPWGFIEDPRVLRSGDNKLELFVDGWYRYARKMHYTVDMIMAFLWGASCGFSHFIPFFYFVFFVGHLTHRQARDDERCKEKYGALWSLYIKTVPYKFIPKVW